MSPAAHSAEPLHLVAWYGVSAVTLYLALGSLALRWRPRTGTRVASYEPPKGISPALAAYLLERGVTDKPFVVAIVNMAAKGYLKIEQGPADYLLSRLNPSIPLEEEEELIASTFFGRDPSFTLSSRLLLVQRAARDVHNQIESIVEPDLISPHFPFLVPALTVSFWCLVLELYPEMQSLWNAQFTALLVLPVFLAVWSLLAVIRTLPATLYKIKSLFPGTPHALRLVRTDRTAPGMFLIALVCLAAIGWGSSWQLAGLFGSFVTVNLIGSLALRAPTSAGHALLHQLDDFRMFFAAVDSDRVNRVNLPNAPSPASEKYWAWALALDIEHAWGEQFAAAVLNGLGPQSAMTSLENNCPEDARASQEILDLHLR